MLYGVRIEAISGFNFYAESKMTATGIRGKLGDFT